MHRSVSEINDNYLVGVKVFQNTDDLVITVRLVGLDVSMRHSDSFQIWVCSEHFNEVFAATRDHNTVDPKKRVIGL